MARQRMRVSEQPTGAFQPRGPRTPPEIYMPAPRPARRRRIWLLAILLPLLLLALVAVVGVAAVYQSDWVLPGVRVLGTSVGAQSVEQARATLERSWARRQVTVQAPSGESVTVSAEQLGILLDAAATARRAHRHGRSLPSLALLLEGQQVAPVWYLDVASAEATLNNMAQRFAVAPRNADIRLEGTELVATAAEPGKAVDMDATVALLTQEAAQVALSGNFTIVVEEVPPTVSDVSEAVTAGQAMLSRSLELIAYDPVLNERVVVTVPPSEWVRWVTPHLDLAAPGGIQWQISIAAVEDHVANRIDLGQQRYLDPAEATNALVAAIREEQAPARLRVYHHARQHTVSSGESLATIADDYGIPYPWIQQANPALGDGLRIGETIMIPSPDALLPLAVVEDKRIVISLGEQRMWAYENGSVKWEWPVSTGIESSPTAPGVFQIQSHEENAYASIWDLWMPKFMGIYRPVPTSDFMNGFHGFPTRNGTNLLWTNSLGRPVTYGCILVSNDNIAQLYEWAEPGTVVEVRR